MNPGRPLPAEDLDFIVRDAAPPWSQFRGARLFITGVTGFFGRWLLESLFAADKLHGLGVRVVGLSRDPGKFLDAAPHLAVPGLSWVAGSVATLEPDALGGEGADMVIHLATEADLRADPRAAAAVITEGTRRALALAVRARARRFLFTSSGAAYGRQPPDMERMAESYSGRPDPRDESWAYSLTGEAKRQAELLCETCAGEEGLGVVIARCFTFAGPGLPADSKFAFGNFMRDALRGEPIVIEGDGTPVRSYLHAADLAAWLWALLLRGTPARAYNVGSEHAVSLLQLAETMSQVLKAPGIEVRRKAVPGAAPDRYVPSTKRAREELGLAERFSLQEVVTRAAAWHRAQVKR